MSDILGVLVIPDVLSSDGAPDIHVHVLVTHVI